MNWEDRNNKSASKTLLLYALLIIIGLVLGALIFGSGSRQDHDSNLHGDDIVWICSMHPQIRQDDFGRCPLCAMDLIPVNASGGSDNPNAVQMSDEAIALANVHTTRVQRNTPVKHLNLYGTVMPNQRLEHSQSSSVNGRIERLVVSTVGETVTQGQVIITIFSPDLLNAQQELLEAQRMSSTHPALLNAARDKLRFWNLTEEQITEIEQSGVVSPHIDIRASISGILINRRVNQGDYVNVGTVLFDIIDLSSVWTVFDAFEADIPYLRTGDLVQYTLPSLPGRQFSGRISFIEPMLDQTTRTAKIRVETNNPRQELKPGMFANATISATLRDIGETIIIPKTAVLWTGRRSIVYVKIPEYETPTFILREIELGPSLGDDYVVLAGIFEGEEIVTRGAFAIDASAQLEGRRSMMNLGDNRDIGSLRQETLTVQGLCSMCKETIENAAMSISGVTVAMWNSETKQLRVIYNPNRTNLNNIARAIADVGYDNERYRASDAVYNQLHACCLYRVETINLPENRTITTQPAENSIIQTTMTVQGNCGMCKTLIETTAKAISGVINADWDSRAKLITLSFDASQTTLDTIAKAIADVGYDNERYRADDEVYNALHACCLYRQ